MSKINILSPELLLARAMIRTEIDALRIEIERLRGNDTEYDSQLRLERERPNKTLHEVIDSHVATRNARITAASQNTERKHFAFLRRVLPDKPIREYTEQDILDAAEVIKRWPAQAMSRKDLAHLTTAEIIARQDLGPPMATATIKKRLTLINSVFGYAAENNWIDRSPCPKKWRVERTKQRNERGELVGEDRHLPWSIAEILRLLETSYYTKPRYKIKNAENYWLPLLALHTGCRLNELCQLYCDDLLQTESGLWMFRITDNSARLQKVKNENSNRLVPIHRELIDLGLLEYRSWVKGQGHDRMWPGLPYRPSNNDYGQTFGDRFGIHTKKFMTWDDPTVTKVYHGFRSTVIATLRHRNKVPQADIDYITGHAPQDKMGSHYAGRPPAEVMHETIYRLEYGVDFVGLLGRWNAKDGGIR